MTPPCSLDTAIAEALTNHQWKGSMRNADGALDCVCGEWVQDMEEHQAAAVRRAVCDWLREDEGAKEAMADERRKHYTKATPDCVCGWKNDRTGHMSNQHRAHAEERVLARLLAYMEGDG